MKKSLNLLVLLFILFKSKNTYFYPLHQFDLLPNYFFHILQHYQLYENIQT
jgi:hypothetical protein